MPVLVPDPAAHLDVEATLSGNGGDGVKVGQGAVLGAVQVHHMEVSGTGGDEVPGHGAGVLGVDRLFVIVSLIQADHLSAPQVNGGKNLHRPRLLCQSLFLLSRSTSTRPMIPQSRPTGAQ